MKKIKLKFPESAKKEILFGEQKNRSRHFYWSRI